MRAYDAASKLQRPSVWTFVYLFAVMAAITLVLWYRLGTYGTSTALDALVLPAYHASYSDRMSTVDADDAWSKMLPLAPPPDTSFSHSIPLVANQSFSIWVADGMTLGIALANQQAHEHCRLSAESSVPDLTFSTPTLEKDGTQMLSLSTQQAHARSLRVDCDATDTASAEPYGTLWIRDYSTTECELSLQRVQNGYFVGDQLLFSVGFSCEAYRFATDVHGVITSPTGETHALHVLSTDLVEFSDLRAPGTWLVRVEAASTVKVVRSVTFPIDVMERTVFDIQGAEVSRVDNAGLFQVSLRVAMDSSHRQTDPSEAVMVSMQVWVDTDGSNGVLKPVGTVSGLALLGNVLSKRFSLPAELKDDAIYSFSVLDARVYTDSMHEMTRMAKVPTVSHLGRLPTAPSSTTKTFSVESVTLRPTTTTTTTKATTRTPTATTKAPTPRISKGRTLHRFLVRGYCLSGDFWDPVIGKIGNTHVWEPPTDPYAPGVPQQALALSKYMEALVPYDSGVPCSATGHSQGGLVVSYVLANYRTCLNNNDNNLRVVAIATPWAGSTVAGIPAIIGDVARITCGPYSQLSPGAARLYSMSLGVEVLSRVYAFALSSDTSSNCGAAVGKPDCCSNAISAFLLHDPNDSLVEIQSQQFVGNYGAHLLGVNSDGSGKCSPDVPSMQCASEDKKWKGIAHCIPADFGAWSCNHYNFPTYQCHGPLANYPCFLNEPKRLAWLEAHL